MDGVDLRLFRHANDVLDVEVGGDGFLAFADEIGLIGLEAMQREAVFRGIDGHRADVHFGCGTHHADGYLAAVGDEDGGDLFHGANLTL
jgi:hypothetical protein